MNAVRDAESRAKLGDLKKQFATFEQNAGPILRELQKLVSARQAGAQLQAGSEQLQSAVQAGCGIPYAAGRDLDRLSRPRDRDRWPSCTCSYCSRASRSRSSPTSRSAAQAEAENKRNQEAILRLPERDGRPRRRRPHRARAR